MTFAELETLAAPVVARTLHALPAPLRAPAERVPVHLQPSPDADILAEGLPDDLLGLFTGSELGSELREDQPMPAQILLYLDNIWDFADGDLTAFRDEVRLTYLHELGHYFGWDEDDLAARGLD
jgi:predicted Zn-dependent protease with MMP-like domain